MAYPTILDVLKLEELTTDKTELIDLLDQEYRSSRDAGDYLGAGEWLASKLHHVVREEFEETFANIVAIWSLPAELKTLPRKLSELVQSIGEYAPNELARSLVAAICVARRAFQNSQMNMNDLAVRLEKPISELINQSGRRPSDALKLASSTLDSRRDELLAAVRGFFQANAIAAKPASIEVVRKAHELRRWVIAAERPMLTDIEMLLGAPFRKFCENCERHESGDIVRRAPELKELAKRLLVMHDSRKNSVLWNLIVAPCIHHVIELVEDEVLSTEVDTLPFLKLASDKLKLDLTKCDREMSFSCRLVNQGTGRAYSIQPSFDLRRSPIEFKVIEPRESFDIGGQSQQIVTFGIVLKEQTQSLSIPVVWNYVTATNRNLSQSETIIIEQQHVQPNWKELLEDPPYSINPITKKNKLYGRDAILQRLLLNALNGTSTFLWGQKRVGKTSVLQVLASEIRTHKNLLCIVLRMGELAPLHEGQIAHRVAERLLANLPNTGIALPNENEFGAGMGSLIPFIEKLTGAVPQHRFVVIVDEFDDLNPTLYTGERGKLFVKALRSLSESGLTFFFVGSERMATIHRKHEVDLNKWVNIHLDCIESREDCKSLIGQPVAGAIEYQPECVELITDYCGRNPFYMHLLCDQLFQSCMQEQRTFVSESDLQHVQGSLTRALGITSFSHFWDDNPELSDTEKSKQAAENCLVLTCLANLGGVYDNPDEVVDKQDKMDLGISERVSNQVIRSVIARLQERGIIRFNTADRRMTVGPPIFRSWLLEYAELQLLPRWKYYCTQREQGVAEATVEVSVGSAIEKLFPISEEDLLGVSQYLDYCGKKKDVSELRVWLRQFDDDIRIELAFLLIKRLAEKGFVSSGAKTVELTNLEDALQAKRQEIGGKTWTFVRQRKDNLCVSFLDSEMKSGGTTAREFAKRVRPGKEGTAASITDWMKTHSEKDALVVMVDDFAGTGSSAAAGLNKFMGRFSTASVLDKFLKEKRILCLFLYAFPEALEKLKKEFKGVQFIAAHVFDDEVRAFNEDAAVFRDKQEIKFAKEFLTQIGRELYPQNPLGFGDMGALVCFHNTIPNNTLPIFWSNGTVNDRPWKPLFPRA